MKKSLKRFAAAAVTGLLAAGTVSVTALADTDAIDCGNASVEACEGNLYSSYTFSQTAEEDTTNVVFVCTITAVTGTVSFNDWCTLGCLVTDSEGTHGYEFGGSAVSWAIDYDGDGVDDTGKGGDDETTWLGSVSTAEPTFVIDVPVTAAAGETYTVDFYAPCYSSDNGTEIYTVDYAIINGDRKTVKAEYVTEAETEEVTEEATEAETEEVTEAETEAPEETDQTAAVTEKEDSDSFPLWVIPVIVGVVVVGAVVIVAATSGKKR